MEMLASGGGQTVTDGERLRERDWDESQPHGSAIVILAGILIFETAIAWAVLEAVF